MNNQKAGLKHLSSGIFRIAVRRGLGAIGVEWSGVWWRGLGTQKKIVCPQKCEQNCVLMQFLSASLYFSKRGAY